MLSGSAKQKFRPVLEIDPAAKLETRAFGLGTRENTRVISYRPVHLSGLAKPLENVRAFTPQVALVGPSPRESSRFSERSIPERLFRARSGIMSAPSLNAN